MTYTIEYVVVQREEIEARSIEDAAAIAKARAQQGQDVKLLSVIANSLTS